MTDQVYVRKIPEVVVPGKPLGRHVHHDPRSKAPEHRAEVATSVKDVIHDVTGLPLNQGAVGKCTAEALAGALNTKPNYTGGHVFTDKDTDDIYEHETALEGHPWTPGDTQDDIGGSGLMVCKAGKQMGLIKSYKHALGLEAALKALVLRPTIWGVDWYEGFDKPDHNGLVKIAGQVRGGHEIMARQILVANRLVGFVQSWGEFGVKGPGLSTGCFYISWDDLETLLGQDGDCTVPMP